MDNIEITVFDEINDYKEKIYFFNFRQWAFAILIVALVVPIYIMLKDKIGNELTSYIVILIAGFFGFIGFVRIHELPAEKVLPFWLRHYFCFAKPIHYISDADFKLQHQKKSKKTSKSKVKNTKKNKLEIKELEKKKKHKISLIKFKDKNKLPKTKLNNKEINNKESELIKKLSKLPKEQQEALLKLLER